MGSGTEQDGLAQRRSIAALVGLSRDVADAADPSTVPLLLAGAAVRHLGAGVVAVYAISAAGDAELVELSGCTAAELVESEEGLGHAVPQLPYVRTWPLASAGGLFGTLVLGYAEPPAADLDELAQGLADIAAVGLDRAFRTRELLDTIRKLEESREQLARTETLRKLGQMAAVVAHEVKNPLASIGGVLQVLQGRAREASERDILGRVLERLRELDRLVDELLQFARPRGPVRVALPLRAVLEDVVGAVHQDPATERVEIELDSCSATACVDRGMLQRVVLNLVLNAVQAMDGQGTVTLSCAQDRDGAFVEISITDTGPGIPPELRERVFEPFYTTKARGSGLGLAVARQVAEAHGGTLVVTAGPSGGARFVLRLPTTSG